MKTATKYFGEVEYEEEDVLRIPKGLYGFEEERDFLLLPFAGGKNLLFCLQSLKTPPLAFVLVDPFSVCPSYAPEPQEEELRELGVSTSEDLYFYTMCVVRDPIEESTVNLRCPIAVNGETYEGMQVILEDDQYRMRHQLSEFRTGEGDGSC